MTLTSKRELISFLESAGLKPKKGLSQNFLIDANIVKKIVSQADIEEGDKVLEVGPGPGALTEALLNAGAHVTAVEKDAGFAAKLSRLGPVTVYQDDILETDIASLVTTPTKVVANLPYQITSPILARLVPSYPLLSTLTLMVQKEVAERMTKESGSLKLFLDFYAESHLAFTVSKNCFYPAPKVDSAVVHIKLKKPPEEINATNLFLLIHTAFNKRRKMIRSSLKDLLTLEEIEQAEVSPSARPEELSLADFSRMSQILQK